MFLQLEGKNLGIVLPDADIETAVQQIVLGSTTYNGQRCTAIKLVMVMMMMMQCDDDDAASVTTAETDR